MNKDEFVKVQIDIKNVQRERIISFLKDVIRRIEKTEPYLSNSDYHFIEGGSVLCAFVTINNKDLESKEILLCKSCKRPMDIHAIISTKLCTACFTSNA